MGCVFVSEYISFLISFFILLKFHPIRQNIRAVKRVLVHVLLVHLIPSSIFLFTGLCIIFSMNFVRSQLKKVGKK